MNKIRINISLVLTLIIVLSPFSSALEFAKFIQPDSQIADVYNPQDLNRYSYVRNNPYKYVDPTGNYVESLLDVGFISLDIHDITENPSNPWNYVALAADMVGLALPGATGGRILVKGAEKGVDAVRMAEKSSDAFKYLERSQDVIKAGGDIKDVVRVGEKAGGGTAWLDVKQWEHIVEGRGIGTADNQFTKTFGEKFKDPEKVKDLIMQTVKEGEFAKTPSGGAYFKRINENYYLRVGVDSSGRIKTAHPEKADKVKKILSSLKVRK